MAIAEGGDDVVALDLIVAGEVGDRPRHSQRAIAAAGAEVAAAIGVEEWDLGFVGQVDVTAQQACVHVSVAQGARPLEPRRLTLARRDRTLRVARTIADLASKEHVERDHVIAALGYRHEAADVAGVAA